jgi:hypothetical protein
VADGFVGSKRRRITFLSESGRKAIREGSRSNASNGAGTAILQAGIDFFRRSVPLFMRR